MIASAGPQWLVVAGAIMHFVVALGGVVAFILPIA